MWFLIFILNARGGLRRANEGGCRFIWASPTALGTCAFKAPATSSRNGLEIPMVQFLLDGTNKECVLLHSCLAILLDEKLVTNELTVRFPLLTAAARGSSSLVTRRRIDGCSSGVAIPCCPRCSACVLSFFCPCLHLPSALRPCLLAFWDMNTSTDSHTYTRIQLHDVPSGTMHAKYVGGPFETKDLYRACSFPSSSVLFLLCSCSQSGSWACLAPIRVLCD